MIAICWTPEFDAFDLRAARIDRSGDGELIDEPTGNQFGVVRPLVHVMVVVVGFADIGAIFCSLGSSTWGSGRATTPVNCLESLRSPLTRA
jgi:hypothetical protein